MQELTFKKSINIGEFLDRILDFLKEVLVKEREQRKEVDKVVESLRKVLGLQDKYDGVMVLK